VTPRAALENLAAIDMVDVHLPATDERTLILSRYTEREQEQRILLDRLRLTLPVQPPRGSPPPFNRNPSKPACSADPRRCANGRSMGYDG